ncbi:hypothetical protein [Haloarcula sp. Atlit-47R]|uniref:hypothetical protein n=1 Tax=Haloarcula sp. Atlit-47R TaxID=2282132 RepID=UPI0013140CA4|nr:hypothetical protein [Haloarcula sp. Atlit-47R]
MDDAGERRQRCRGPVSVSLPELSTVEKEADREKQAEQYTRPTGEDGQGKRAEKRPEIPITD